jgi:hypothetical protein
MDEQGLSAEQREHELRRYEELIERLQEIAEDGAIDEHPEAG